MLPRRDDVRIRLSRPHAYVTVERPIEGSTSYEYKLTFTTHEVDKIDELIEALQRAKDLLGQA